MKKLKKIILAVLCVVCVIALTPNTAKAEQKTYWNTNGNKKYITRKTYDIDKYTPDEFVRLAIANGSQADRQGKVIYSDLQFKASSEKDAIKKFESYASKVKKAPSNKYGLSFGLNRDVEKSLKYNKETQLANYSYQGYFNNIYYIQRLFDLAMNEPYLEVDYNNRDTKVSTNFYRQKTRSVFKNADALKKASDSVKFQFLCSYLNDSCRIMYGKVTNPLYDGSLKAILASECKGQCVDLTGVWNELLSLVASDYESRDYVCWRGTSETSHGAKLFRVKNKNGKWDYFQGNNNKCVLFGNAFRKEYVKGIDLYDACGKGFNYDIIEDWMHYDKKAYVDGYGSFGKNAYKYGKAHTKSELVNLMISKKAKYYDKGN